MMFNLEAAIVPQPSGFVEVFPPEPAPEPEPDITGPLGEAEAAARYAVELNSSLKPFDLYELQLVDVIALQTVRIAHCQQQQRDLRAGRARRAATRWDDDRRDEAVALGVSLRKSPELVARQLRRSKHGCDWIIGRWKWLMVVLTTAGKWDKVQTRMAFDLMGVPAEFRSGPSPMDLGRDGCLHLIRGEIDGLEREKAGALDEIDRQERAIAEKGDGPDEGGELAILIRREQMFSCRSEWAKDQLKKGRHAHPTLNGPGGGYPPTQTPKAPPAPPRRPEKTEEEWRQVTMARAAIKQAEAEPQPEPVLAPSPSPMPEVIPEPPPDPVELTIEQMTNEQRMEAIKTHPDFLALSPSGRLSALMTGDPTGRPLNRNERRTLEARARRGR